MLQINPYIRFARIHGKPLIRIPVTALDHRIFYCVDGSGEITVGDRAYSMKPGAFLFTEAGFRTETPPLPTGWFFSHTTSISFAGKKTWARPLRL